MAARSTLTVVSGNTITSAWGNSVRDHLVPFTTSNDVASEGQLASNTSTNRVVVYDGAAAVEIAPWGAWDTWSPSLGQGAGNATITVSRASYARHGRTIHFQAVLSVTATGGATGGFDVTVPLPVTAAYGGAPIGVGEIYDASANVVYHGVLIASSTTVCKIRSTTPAGSPFFLGSVAFTAALANGDAVSISGTYEAAS